MTRLSPLPNNKSIWIDVDSIVRVNKTNKYRNRTRKREIKCVNERHFILKMGCRAFDELQSFSRVRVKLGRLLVYTHLLSKGVELDYYFGKHFAFCQEYLCLGSAGLRKYEYELKRKRRKAIDRYMVKRNAYHKARRWYEQEREASIFLGFDILRPWSQRKLNINPRYRTIRRDGYDF